MMRTLPMPTSIIDVSRRDIACFTFAVAVHSLLFLWQGGILEFQGQESDGLGDSIVQVGFLSEVPNWDPVPTGGGRPEASKGIFARVRSMIKREAPRAPAAEPTGLAMGQTEKIDVSAAKLDATDTKLSEKLFDNKKGFQGVTNKKENLAIAMGQTNQAVVQPSQGNFEKTKPNLQEKSFKMAAKDTPFKIVTKQSDELVNVNAVPISVGEKTTPSIRSLDGGPGAGPALQSKAIASKGSALPNGSGFGSLGKSQGASKDSGAAAGLAMGGGSSKIENSGSFGGSGGGVGGGVGSQTGPGTGSGSRASGGTGSASGSGSGKSWGGGTGIGTGMGSGTRMAALPRNTVAVHDSSAQTSKNSGFSITGALANRPVIQKRLPSYEIDARVALRFRVDWSGKVLDGIVVEISSGSPTYDQKVIAALKQWLFTRLSTDRSHEIQEGVITFVFRGV